MHAIYIHTPRARVNTHAHIHTRRARVNTHHTRRFNITRFTGAFDPNNVRQGLASMLALCSCVLCSCLCLCLSPRLYMCLCCVFVRVCLCLSMWLRCDCVYVLDEAHTHTHTRTHTRTHSREVWLIGQRSLTAACRGCAVRCRGTRWCYQVGACACMVWVGERIVCVCVCVCV